MAYMVLSAQKIFKVGLFFVSLFCVYLFLNFNTNNRIVDMYVHLYMYACYCIMKGVAKQPVLQEFSHWSLKLLTNNVP